MPETTDKDREEERRREAMDFARKIFKTFTGELQAHPIDITFERDARIRAEAKAEAQVEIEALRREIDLCYSMWTGRNYGHLPLHEALGKAMADREAEARREAAEMADEAIVKWFDPFSLYDIEDDLGEIRHKVEYAITHADDPNKEE